MPRRLESREVESYLDQLPLRACHKHEGLLGPLLAPQLMVLGIWYLNEQRSRGLLPGAMSPNIDRNVFNLSRDCIQVNDQAELVERRSGSSRDRYFRIWILGAWDQHALSASKFIAHLSK